jgi:trehalose synthase
MARIQEIDIKPQPLERFEPLCGKETVREAIRRARVISQHLAGRAVWNINSTPSGGGVAEMLQTILAYPRAAGIDVRWGVIEGSPEFFRITKRLHQALHGLSDDGSPLGNAQHAIYERVLSENAEEFRRIINPGDLVILHDPQTAGLAPHLLAHGCGVAWRSHIGDERVSAESEYGWAFLSRYLEDVPISIFSRHAYVPPGLDESRVAIVAPSIDPFSAKSEALDAASIQGILEHTGLVQGQRKPHPYTFTTLDGSVRSVDRPANFVTDAEPPRFEDPLVVQVSRWDVLKDPQGVTDAFTRVIGRRDNNAHLMLAGPDVTGVADDPEAAATMQATLDHWHVLPDFMRERIHLVSLPTADTVENASVVNALQSHAAVVVQKSIREGFGLTVTEAMWKGRPVVASRVGGIQDQIEHRVDGILLDDPSDYNAAGFAISELLNDPELASRLGTAAREKVRENFLPPRHLLQYADLIEGCLFGEQ